MVSLNIFNSEKVVNVFRIILTAWPGFVKLLMLWIVGFTGSADDLGLFAAYIGIQNFVVLFASSGVISLVLVRMHERIFLGNYYVVVFVKVLMAGAFASIIGESYWLFVLIALFWSVYLIFRAICISKMIGVVVFFVEFLAIVVFLFLVYFGAETKAALLVYYAFLVAFFLFLIGECSWYDNKLAMVDLIVKSLGLSFSNVISGGLVFLFPFFVLSVYGAEMSAFVGVCLSLAMFVTLIPRALSYKYLPVLRGAFEGNTDFDLLYKDFSSRIFKVLCLVTSLFLLFYPVFVHFFDVFKLEFDYFMVYLAVIILIFSMQVAFSLYCLLQVHEKAFVALLSNVITFFCVLVVVYLSERFDYGFIWFVNLISFVYFCRYCGLRLWVKGAL